MAYDKLSLAIFKDYKHAFDSRKSVWLERERGIGFEQIISFIEEEGTVKVYKHPNPEKYPDQFVYHVEMEGHIYVVPFIVEGKTAFLKTIYPSRKATKLRRRET